MMDLLGWENWKNWTDQFEQKHAGSWTEEEILERVRGLERRHWAWCVTGIVVAATGGAAAVFSPVAGCMSVLTGFLLVIGTKLASSNALCTFHLLWDMRKREEEAVRVSEVQDL